jgi:uncharacterized glyoxalase superfamily protein PhnB
MHATIPPPKGWPRIASSLYYRDAAAMIDWLCTAFGFEIILKVEGENGEITHSELRFGESLIMVNSERIGAANRWGIDFKSPLSVGRSNTQGLMLFVDDVEAHCAQARAAGATIADEPSIHDYGEDYWTDRSYGAIDPEGHLWWFTQRLKGQ